MILPLSPFTKKSILKPFIEIILTITFTFFLLIPFLKEVKAQIPPPTVPCNETRVPEFHSLRPYQASPCNQNLEDLALYCGNDFIMADNIVITKTTSRNDSAVAGYTHSYQFEGQPISPIPCAETYDVTMGCTYCQNGRCLDKLLHVGSGSALPWDYPCIPGIECSSDADCQIDNCEADYEAGTQRCCFNIDRIRNIALDLEDAYLPIMGNTECAVNSQNNVERCTLTSSTTITSAYGYAYGPPGTITIPGVDVPFTDNVKVNEYVSWYLNGVNGRAEYNPPNPETEEGLRKIIDFSGPLKKLLSWESQTARRIQEVQKAAEDTIRHNQIVGCRNGEDPNKCYFPTDSDRLRIEYWINRLPPLSSAYAAVEDFWNDYQDWKNTNANFSKLFSYIPFSSTEDRKGDYSLASYFVQPASASNVVVLFTAILQQNPADLFFAHMQEGYELSDLAQSIFNYQGADPNAEPENSVAPWAPYCDIKELRTNPGDNLFAGVLTATVEYVVKTMCDFVVPGSNASYPNGGILCDAIDGNVGGGTSCVPSGELCAQEYGKVDCEGDYKCSSGCGLTLPEHPADTSGWGCYAIPGFDPYTGELPQCYPNSYNCATTYGDSSSPDYFLCPTGYQCGIGCSYQVEQVPWTFTEECSNPVNVAFQTQTTTPLAKEVWTKLVAGPTSVFRRIFPKIGDAYGSPIKYLWDLPTVTKANFYDLMGNLVLAGNPTTGRPGSEAEIYFPHIGGVHEYFLKCIQKTLRPQGFGEGCVSGPPPLYQFSGNGASCADLAVSPIYGNYCDPGWLSSFFAGCGGNISQKAQIAACICMNESGGNANAINCRCLNPGDGIDNDNDGVIDCADPNGDSATLDYSIGLFQINVLAHCGVPGQTTTYGWSNPPWCSGLAAPWCIINDQATVDACVAQYSDAATNAQIMVQLSSCGNSWGAWKTSAAACGAP